MWQAGGTAWANAEAGRHVGGERNSGCRNRSQSTETQSTEGVGERELVTCADGGALGSREINIEMCVKSQGQTR